MASVVTEANGRRLIQWMRDGRRHTIRLGRASRRDAEAVRARIEDLLAAQALGRAIDEDAAAWLRRIPAALAAKLARTGLIETPATPASTDQRIGAFLEACLARRPDLKPATLRSWRQVIRDLLDYFGADRSIGSITPADADGWQVWLTATRNLATETTARHRCAVAKAFFALAVELEVLARNPLARLTARIRPRPERQRFIDAALIGRVFEALPDAWWRGIVALGRYGGLRCPGEVQALRWEDVRFGDGWMVVHSPKTERYGQPSRRVPIFPELRPYLEDLYDLAEPGAIHVIRRRSGRGASWHAGLARYLTRAGIEPWPRLFHNLRATRQTELTATWPEHVVCAWLGNSRPVARRHYLQVTDADFARAAGLTVTETTPQWRERDDR